MKVAEQTYQRFIRPGLQLIICLLLVEIFFKHRGINEQRQLDERIERANRQIAFLEREIFRSQRKIQAIGKDPIFEECVIRQYLGYMRPRDQVIYFNHAE